MKTTFSYICLLCLLATVISCRPSKESVNDFVYFEKNLDTLNTLIKELEEPIIKSNDILSINVSSASLDQTQTQVFNLLNNPGAGGGGGMAGGAMQGYLVDYDGTITMPLLGKIKAEGLTKNILIDTLTRRLQPYVMNPVLNVRFMNFRVMMLGEVRTGGWQTFANERATIVEAIAQAGGLTDFGKRENILLIRENTGGKREYHTINLNDASIFASPYYQLQQNDIVYVLPNNTRLLQYERQNSPFFRDLPLYMGLITAIVGFVAIFVAIFN
jgi:polysaccharide export outer membrane protein